MPNLPEGRFFITEDNKIRWIKLFIRTYIEWDVGATHLAVSMANSLNSPTSPKDCLIESISTENIFNTLREAQIEILIRERF